jgi:hypothetical protein
VAAGQAAVYRNRPTFDMPQAHATMPRRLSLISTAWP